jgi:hypothetical protein
MEILLKSLAAAVVTAIILVIAKYAGAKLAGAIGGIPIVFAISYILLTMEDKSTSKDFLVGGIYGAIAAICFSLILIFLNNKFPNMHWTSFAVAYVLCFFVAYGLVHFSQAK